ncbi:STAS domain-containing protein [Clostridium saccharobutylicum]|uniref:RsbT antagonist protein RsbS n=1 Tax=Clostridium saccharobutylicum DSM 13864 TaxID=1345695 RepID=U5MUC4_CLOSA|nr:STAS domain-containing protein [Clostridium saccharobutylicum]AGX43032.1 RsbT antagonist protein RsbS [Clostridium saccharobutylicum DSM 13864]AQR90323.1 RsbT antagonist protein RsbS [Clostridium saccharobutylicum]AQS00229.1 RsbT antagonist protein RsbS [Clostridium saccharobutylicum]AQS10028.1 RsbT antagonist protein RsbS [Clostridium saccharobutylicum]AQS14212.1 RsbT antagonist protein RsbS [Clostridium saccharobutylicum]
MGKIPIIKIRNFLIVSLDGDLTDKSAIKLQSDILNKVYENTVKGVLIDISILDMVDSYLGKIIADMSAMIKLLGAETVLVGMKPNVAITLVEMGFNIDGIATSMNVETGIEMLENIIKSNAIQEVFFNELLKVRNDDM